MKNKNLIRDLFINLYENKKFDLNDITTYLSKDYVKHIDGKVLNFDQYIEYIKELRSKMTASRVEFKTLISDIETNVVFSNHRIYITYENGREIKLKIIAEFRLRDGKLYYCDELTYTKELKPGN